MSSKLSPHQIAQSVYDEPSESIRTTIQNLEIGIELDADDGDSVEVRKPLFHTEVEVSSGTASGTVLGQGDVRYFSEYQVAVNIITDISASGLAIHIEVSPSDTDDVWHFDNNNLIKALSVPNTGFGHLKDSTVGPWRRARAVLVHNGFTAGSFKLYMSGR
jgi:hypothetical protein